MSESVLEMAIRHVAAGRRIVAEQERLVEELRRDGHVVHAKRAEELLQTYRRSLELFEQDLADTTEKP